MIIRDLLNLAISEKKKRSKKARSQKLVVGIGAATTAAAIGVVTGILIAPRSGKETRANLRKKSIKSVASVKNAIEDTAEAVKKLADNVGEEAADASQGVQAKADSAKKKA